MSNTIVKTGSVECSCPIFVINLTDDLDRRKHMDAQLAAVGLQAEFVPAVDGRAA